MFNKFLKTKFSKFIFYTFSVITVIFVLILFLLWDYLDQKNIASPEYFIKNYISMIEEKNYYEAFKFMVKEDIGFNNYDNFKYYIINKYGDNIKSITAQMVKGKESDKFYFDIYINGEIKDNISLYYKGEKGRYNINQLSMDIPKDIYINDLYIYAPTDASVHINGYFLDENYLSKDIDVLSFETYFYNQNKKGMNLYKVPNLVSSPNVTVKDNKGSVLECIYYEETNVYIAGFFQTDEELEKQKEFIKNVVSKYIKFNIYRKDVDDLISNVQESSKLYDIVVKTPKVDIKVRPFEILNVDISGIIKIDKTRVIADTSTECSFTSEGKIKKETYKFKLYINIDDEIIKLDEIKNLPN